MTKKPLSLGITPEQAGLANNTMIKGAPLDSDAGTEPKALIIVNNETYLWPFDTRLDATAWAARHLGYFEPYVVVPMTSPDEYLDARGARR